jgi:3-(3-hydroxy-phenyl)propionate hydroxylase
VQVHLQAEVTGQGQDATGAWIDVRLRQEEHTTRVTGQYLVACDGGASPIRTRLGIGLEDLDFHEPWLVVDVIVNEDRLGKLPQTQVQYCEAGRPSTFVVLPGNHRRWEIMLLPGDSLSPEFPENELWPLLSRWIQPGDGKLWRAAAYRFHGLVANAWREGRILLAGDAAHMTPPFMAQGMAQGLRDAQNLCWKLERVLAGTSPTSLLDTYGEERRPHVVETTRTAIELGRVICERDPALARQRDDRLVAEQGGEVRTVFRQNMIPSLKHGLIAQDAPGAGSLFPQPHIRAVGFDGRLDDLTGRGIRVAVLGTIDAAAQSQWLELLAPCGGTLIEVGALQPTESRADGPTIRIEELEPVMAPWLTSLGQTVAIARPDNYVYGTAKTTADGIAMLQQLLRSLAA